jgi:hypothetical protein
MYGRFLIESRPLRLQRHDRVNGLYGRRPRALRGHTTGHHNERAACRISRAVRFSTGPHQPLRCVRKTARAAIAAVRGTDAVSAPATDFVPHGSIAYNNALQFGGAVCRITMITMGHRRLTMSGMTVIYAGSAGAVGGRLRQRGHGRGAGLAGR